MAQKSQNTSKQDSKKTLNKIMSFDTDSESENDLITVKRTNHEIEQEIEDDDVLDIGNTKQKKVVTQAAILKKLQKKHIIPNRKTVFDEEGNSITNTEKTLQSELAKEYENDDEAGINIDKARRLLEERDKYDKQRFKELVQKRHKEAKKKSKKSQENEESEKDEFGTDSEGDEPDLSWLPDPDNIYGKNKTYDSEEEFDPRVATGSSSEEDSEEELEAIHRAPTKLVTKKVGKKRQLEEDLTVVADQKKKKSSKKQKTEKIVSSLSINEAEQLAMQLLG